MEKMKIKNKTKDHEVMLRIGFYWYISLGTKTLELFV